MEKGTLQKTPVENWPEFSVEPHIKPKYPYNDPHWFTGFVRCEPCGYTARFPIHWRGGVTCWFAFWVGTRGGGGMTETGSCNHLQKNFLQYFDD